MATIPVAALDSIRYIMHSLTGGKLDLALFEPSRNLLLDTAPKDSVISNIPIDEL